MSEYSGETKKIYEKIKKNNSEKKKKEELNAFFQRKESRRRDLKRMKEDIRAMIRESSKFLTNNTLFPRKFTDNHTLMEIYLSRLDDYIKEDPLAHDKKIEKFIKEEKYTIKKFERARRKVERVMPKIKKYKETLRKDSTELLVMLELEQELYLSLQSGNLTKMNEILKKIDRKI